MKLKIFVIAALSIFTGCETKTKGSEKVDSVVSVNATDTDNSAFDSVADKAPATVAAAELPNKEKQSGNTINIKATRQGKNLTQTSSSRGVLQGINVHFGQGLKGHPDYTRDKIPLAIQLAKDMKFNAFRSDFTLDAEGKPSTNGDLFLKAANDAGIQVFAIIYVKGRGRLPDDGSTYSANELEKGYRENYKAAFNFAKAYPFIKYFQFDNELEVKRVGKTGKPIINYFWNRYGASSDDSGFNMLSYPLLKRQLEGMLAGVKAANSSAKCGINYAWTHTGLIRKLIDGGIKLDFVGVDPYNSEEYAKAQDGKVAYGRFVHMMKAAFPDVKEHFITEMGFKPSKSNPQKLSQSGYVLPLFTKYASECDGVFFYELFDEPKARATSKDRDEAILGLHDNTQRAFSTRKMISER